MSYLPKPNRTVFCLKNNKDICSMNTLKRFIRSTLAVVALGAGLSMSSCSPFALVNSETYNNADLAAYRTFRIVTPCDSIKLPPTMTEVTYYNIAAAVREQMIERGYVESPESPLLINLGLTVHREIDTEPAVPPGYMGPPPMPYYGPYYNGFSPWFMYPRYNYWPGYYSNAQVITGIYKEGVLTMDFINVPQKRALYSASVATILENGNSQFRDLKGIQEAVQTLFSNFPVKVLPQYK